MQKESEPFDVPLKHEIVAIAPTHDSPIIFLNSPNYTISKKFALVKDYIDGFPFTIAHDDFMNIICMCFLLLLAIIMREELYLHLSMFPTRQNCKKLFILCIGLYFVCMNCSFMTCRCIGSRLLHCLIYVTLCSLLNYKSLLIKIGFDMPWDPGGFTT